MHTVVHTQQWVSAETSLVSSVNFIRLISCAIQIVTVAIGTAAVVILIIATTIIAEYRIILRAAHILMV